MVALRWVISSRMQEIKALFELARGHQALIEGANGRVESCRGERAMYTGVRRREPGSRGFPGMPPIWIKDLRLFSATLV